MIVRIGDVRQVTGYCAKGVRKFIVDQGWDLDDAIKNGIDSEKLKATDNHLAVELVRLLEERNNGRQ